MGHAAESQSCPNSCLRGQARALFEETRADPFGAELQDLDSVNAFFAVSKRICIYLARIAPQQTVDHLVYELSQLINEQDDGADGSRSFESMNQVT